MAGKPKPSHLKMVRTKEEDKQLKRQEELGMNTGIPMAKWLKGSEFDKEEFITEVSKFLQQNYGMGCDVDQHMLGILADRMEAYMILRLELIEGDVMTSGSQGQMRVNPAMNASNLLLDRILKMFSEFGMTPKARAGLNVSKSDLESTVDSILLGPRHTG